LRRNHWLLLLGIALTTLLCCVLATCSLAAFLWLGLDSMAIDQIGAEPTLPEPAVVPTPVRRDPLDIERQTAAIVTSSTLPARDLLDLSRRLQGLSVAHTEGNPGNLPGYKLGDAETFWLHDVNTNSFFTATATLQYETPHAYWWVEDGYSLSERDLEESALNFESGTYPASRSLFGSEWSPGIDGDPHIYIYLGNVPGVGGYFSSPDEYPVQVRPRSNEHEMFYINLDNARPGNEYFDGVLAHEFQHMIHWAIDRDEATWVNEGLSELAAHINDYDVGGSDWLFTENPDSQLTSWPELEDSGPHYGASYLFLAYFLERFGEDAIRQLVAEPANGIAGFDAVLADTGTPQQPFRELFADWVLANYLDDTELADGRYGYADLQIERPKYAAYYTNYPVERQATVQQYAADYILLRGNGTFAIDFSGSQVASLVGTGPHSGEYMWWSNRGDEGDATLTRAFDLSDLGQATLQAWMWYDLESDYDYAYVEISTDGGQTWQFLSNDHTTTANPSGNSYGPGLTGPSGSGTKSVWSQETFDLTPYAGQSVLIRFEVITDEGLNYPGLCLDDISIPELGYTHDAEEDDGDWQAEGWLRVTDHVPQSFLVQLISLGRETHVERMALDERMHGTMTIAGLGQDMDHAILVISALAPATTEWTAYTYQITQQ
jgi:immune inhibitor A